MSVFGTIVRQDVANLLRKPTLVINETLFPLALIGLLGFLNQGFYQNGRIAWDIATVNMLLYAAFNVSMIATNSFMEMTLKATNLRVLYAPIPLWPVYCGKAVATFLVCAGGILADAIFLELVFGINLGPSGGIEFLAILAVLSLASAFFGVFMACLVKREDLANRFLSLINNFFAVLGGCFFSFAAMGETASRIAEVSPFTWISRVAYRAIYDGTSSGFIPLLIACGATGLVFLAASRLIFKPGDYV